METRDIIRDVLATMPDDKVNVQEFADKVKGELLPLKTKNLNDARYENITLDGNIRGPISGYQEKVYNSPIEAFAAAPLTLGVISERNKNNG